MIKDIEQFVKSLSPEDKDKMLTNALCDVVINVFGTSETMDDLKQYINDNFERAYKNVRRIFEDGPQD